MHAYFVHLVKVCSNKSFFLLKMNRNKLLSGEHFKMFCSIKGYAKLLITVYFLFTFYLHNC